MAKKTSVQLSLLLCIITIATQAQDEQRLLPKLGDPAPPLEVSDWLKGEPVQQFEKGKVYVLEFWATWCKPCKAAMPRLSALAREYGDKVTVIGIDVQELKTMSPRKLKAFVDSMGQRMDYRVAAQDSTMLAAWVNVSGETYIGLPSTFVVNATGNLAWVGHPKDLHKVLPQILNNSWDIEEVLARENLDRRLEYLDREAGYDLLNYSGNFYKKDYIGKPDSALLFIDEIVKKEPRLKYMPHIAGHTFSALLKTDPHKAYEYGKALLLTVTDDYFTYQAISGPIEIYSDKLNLPAEIYRLGIEAYQAQIDHSSYPELLNIPRRQSKMAECYWRANDKSKAIELQQKAIELAKNRKDFSATEILAFETKLRQYKTK